MILIIFKVISIIVVVVRPKVLLNPIIILWLSCHMYIKILSDNPASLKDISQIKM